MRANSVVVYAKALDDSGRLDATFDLPSQTLTERVGLDFAFTYTPPLICTPVIAPMTFQIDPRSTLTMRRGGTALGGFQSLPSDFSPRFFVAFDGSSPDQLGYATRVVVDIARLTTTELAPQVVDLQTAASADIGALIVANSNTLKQTALNPPLSGDGSAITVDLPTQLRLDVDRGLGSIQAFADQPHNRTIVLVTTTGAWTLVDPLFDYVDGQPTAGQP